MKRFLAAIALAAALPAVAFAFTSPGNPSGYVNDFAKVLQPATVVALNTELAAFEATTSNQIAVAIVPNMGGDYIEHYAPELFKVWGIGGSEKDNGVLLLIAVEERTVRIEVGYGLEGALPDSIAQRIINNDIVPNLKEGKFDAAVTTAVGNIMLATKNEYVGTGKTGSPNFSDYEALFFALFIALQWIIAILARSKSWWAGGIVGGVLGAGIWWYFALATLWGGASLAGLALIGLLFDYVVSKAYAHSRANGIQPPWWIGGGGLGGGRGGGFGGFGGGMSGGGGASGRW